MRTLSSSGLSLAGEWVVRLDREDLGVTGRWYAHPLADEQRCQLPGSIQAQGMGDDVTADTNWVAGLSNTDRWRTSPRYEQSSRAGAVKIPYFLQPLKYYVGVAWFEREVDVPAEWADRPLRVSLERAHWETRL